MESKTEFSDEHLVSLISENNDDAKDELYRKYSGMIHKELNQVKRSAYALGIEWQDLMQEALLGFSNAINSFRDEEDAKFSTYATLCVRRKLINYINKFTTQKNYTMKSAISLDNTLEDSDTNYMSFLQDNSGREPLNKMMIDESLKEVSNKFKNILTDEEKTIIDYATDGKKPEEIANLTNKSVKQVYNILYRARNKIKIKEND